MNKFHSNRFRRIFIYILLSGFLLLSTRTASGIEPDSLTYTSKKRANRAAIYSAILPGAGQVYNKKYWKVPLIYAGAGTLVYFITTNNKNYKTFRDAYLFRVDGDSSTIDNYPNYTNDDLLVRKDYYRRNRDLSYILITLLYTMNIIDAYVDSQLRDFDVSDNLSLRTDPIMFQNYSGDISAGLKLTFTLK